MAAWKMKEVNTQKRRSVFEMLASCPYDLSELVVEDRRDEVSSFDRVGVFRS